MNKLFSVIAITTLMFSIPHVSHSLGGLEFLSNSAMAHFTPEDTKRFKKTLYNVLNNHPDRKVVKWSNPASKHFGKIKSTKSYTRKNMPCRTIKILNSAGGVVGKATFDFCKTKSGLWKIP